MAPLLSQQPRSERVFERLYRKHAGDVYRYALALLGNAADAEDVTQTTFMNAYRAFQRGQVPERPLNWLIAIAHNVCRQRFRQAARRGREVALDFDVADRLVEDETPRAEDIRRAFSQLTFNQRAALMMRELEGRSYAEIAGILGLSLSAVETLLFRARRALREQLEGALSCSEAERAISRQLDGGLDRAERGPLRAHLRACPECASLGRRMRAQRSSLKALVLVPLPSSLSHFFGGGSTAAGTVTATVGSGLALKAAAVGVTAVLVTGAGYEAVKHGPWHSGRHARPAALSSASAPSTAAAVREANPHRGVAPVAASQAPARPRHRSATRMGAHAAAPPAIPPPAVIVPVAAAQQPAPAEPTTQAGSAAAGERSDHQRSVAQPASRGRSAAAPGKTRARTTPRPKPTAPQVRQNGEVKAGVGPALSAARQPTTTATCPHGSPPHPKSAAQASAPAAAACPQPSAAETTPGHGAAAEPPRSKHAP